MFHLVPSILAVIFQMSEKNTLFRLLWYEIALCHPGENEISDSTALNDSYPATVRVSGHWVPIEPGQLHILVEAVSTAVEERLDASDQLLRQAIDVVAANVAPAACYAAVLPGAKNVGRFAGCLRNMFL